MKIKLDEGIEDFILEALRHTTLKREDLINFLVNNGYKDFFLNNTYEDFLNDMVDYTKEGVKL